MEPLLANRIRALRYFHYEPWNWSNSDYLWVVFDFESRARLCEILAQLGLVPADAEEAEYDYAPSGALPTALTVQGRSLTIHITSPSDDGLTGADLLRAEAIEERLHTAGVRPEERRQS